MDAAKCNAGGVPVMDMNPIQKGIEILKILLATDIGTRETSGLTGCLAHMAGVDFSSLLRFPPYLLDRD